MQKNYIRKKSKCLNFNIFVMNKIDEKDVFNGGKYLPPDIKIVEIKVEKGFAVSGEIEPNPDPDPDNPSDGD